MDNLCWLYALNSWTLRIIMWFLNRFIFLGCHWKDLSGKENQFHLNWALFPCAVQCKRHDEGRATFEHVLESVKRQKVLVCWYLCIILHSACAHPYTINITPSHIWSMATLRFWKLGMGVHTHNLSVRRLKLEEYKFKASLGHIVDLVKRKTRE